jgi:hypothetical protein
MMESLILIPKNTKRKIARQFSIRRKPDKFRQKLPDSPGQAGQVPSKAPDFTGKGKTRYVEDVSLFVSFAFLVVIKYRFCNSLMKSGLTHEIIFEREFCRAPNTVENNCIRPFPTVFNGLPPFS